MKTQANTESVAAHRGAMIVGQLVQRGILRSVLDAQQIDELDALASEYLRLAKKEDKQRKAGAKGGRPRSKQPSPAALAKRKSRAKAETRRAIGRQTSPESSRAQTKND